MDGLARGTAAAPAPATSSPPSRWGRWISLAALAAGVVVVLVLVRRIGPDAILRQLAAAGWWTPVIVALHLPQTLLSAAGWGALLKREARPPLGELFLFRWIREAVNSLLPVAQVGGEMVRVRLLARRDLGVARAGASCAADITVELGAQVLFTALGLALLMRAPHPGAVTPVAIGAFCGLLALVAGLALAPRLLRVPAVQGLAARLKLRRARGAYALAPGQVLVSGGWHLASWLAGALETWAILWAVGVHAPLGEAVVIESLTQLLRVAAFAVPGAIGVQEGGLILICGLYAIAPSRALGVSLMRRLRELVLGAPGLAVWRWVEGRA